MNIEHIKIMRDVVRMLNDTFKPVLIAVFDFKNCQQTGEIRYSQSEKYFSAFYDKATDSWTVFSNYYVQRFNEDVQESVVEILSYLEQEGITCRFDYGLPQTVSVRAGLTKDVYIMPKPISNGIKNNPAS